MFHISDPKDIKSGRVTDVYFARTLEILKARGIDKRVRAEFFAKTLPGGDKWAVLAGIEEVASLMEGRKVNIRCFRDKLVVSFGARRMHPAIAPMIERAAYIGGCDGVAVIVSAELLDVDPMGSMPHALILVLGDTVGAVKAFDEVIDEKVKRVALIDTFNDEKFEAIRVAEAMGKKLFAVRLDTPSSRRGDFYRIFEEVRWELDLRGHKDVLLYASGGLDEKEVAELVPVADAFGVGTCISNAPVVDFAMDIMEIDGAPLAKRGKWSGAKDVLRCPSCKKRSVVPLGSKEAVCACGARPESLFAPLIIEGRVVADLPKPGIIRDGVLKRIKGLEL
ncbi:MAG: nicotinate phosphoribosyltransferase [Deltaproteobacteria bacterium]|nr:nicotinate phosphoribosyltransferase [Deltaproteobacteria bacterium]